MIARNVETDLLVYDVSAVFLCVTTAESENGQEIEVRGRKGEVGRENDFAVVQTSLERGVVGAANGEVPLQIVRLEGIPRQKRRTDTGAYQM